MPGTAGTHQGLGRGMQGFFSRNFRETVGPVTVRCQTSSFQNCERTHFCCKPPSYDTLLTAALGNCILYIKQFQREFLKNLGLSPKLKLLPVLPQVLPVKLFPSRQSRCPYFLPVLDMEHSRLTEGLLLWLRMPPSEGSRCKTPIHVRIQEFPSST